MTFRFLRRGVEHHGWLLSVERELRGHSLVGGFEIDLDDGVKVNYPKLGAALKKIPGLEAKKEK